MQVFPSLSFSNSHKIEYSYMFCSDAYIFHVLDSRLTNWILLIASKTQNRRNVFLCMHILGFDPLNMTFFFF